MSWQLRIYVSIDAETSKVGPSIKKALGAADGHAAAAGKSAGSRMASALGTALKGAAATTGAAAVAGVGVAMAKGFERLNAIDQAKAKLSGLGNSASDVTKIMDNALASVKGTAFGMGDAASLAGVMVAAGVKPGKELESTLKRVADSAAIAGTDLNDMGQIWGKVAAKGKVDGEIVNQMLERQIPIYDILGAKMKKTPEEIADMVSKGKISFQDFSDAMNDKIGGAALKMGDTFKGAFDNVVAAAGRLGASAIEPFFKRSTGGLGSLTDALDAAEPKVKELAAALDSKIFDEWGPKLQQAWASARESGVLDQTLETLRGMAAVGVDVWPALQAIGQALAQASAAVGVGTWQLFLVTLQAASGVIGALTPGLEALGNLMKAHPGYVAAAMAAWTGFRTIPGLVKPMADSLKSVTERAKGFTEAGKVSADTAKLVASSEASMLKAQVAVQAANAKTLVAEEALQKVRATSGATAGQVASAEARVAEARLAATSATTRAAAAQATYAAAQKTAAAEANTFGGVVRAAYAQGAEGATRFTRTAGATSAAMAGARSAASNAGSAIMGAMGGPAGLAIAGVTTAVMLQAQAWQENAQKARVVKDATDQLADSQRDLGLALRKTHGEMTDDVWSSAGKTIDDYTAKVAAVADQHHSVSESAQSNLWKFIVPPIGVSETIRDQNSALQESATNAINTGDAIKKLGMSNEQMARQVYGSNAAWQSTKASLQAMGDGGKQAATDLAALRGAWLNQQIAARAVTPGVTEFGEAVRALGDKSVTAADKLKAIKSAMDALNPARSKAEVMKQMGDSLRAATEAATGIGPAAFDASGKLDAMGEAGGKLSTVLGDLAEKQQQVASTGDAEAIARTNREIEATLQSLANSTNQPIEKIRELYASFGGGKNIDLMVKLSGAPEAVQSLGQIQAKINATPGTKEVTVEYADVKAAIPALDQLGIKYKEIDKGGQKFLKIDVTGDAGAKLQNVINTAAKVPAGKPISVTAPGGQAVQALLGDLGVKVNRDNHKNVEVISPLAPGVRDLLREIGFEVENRNGKNIIVKADDSDYTNKKAANKWTETEIKEIEVRAKDMTNRALSRMPTFNANGSIVLPNTRAYLDGGISAAESFANGGLKEIVKPTRADIFAGRGAGTIFAEQETGGEAYIPLAASKRGRSTDILATVARMFGLAVVPADSISGLLGGIAGGAVSSLLKKAGADKLTRFADGGISAAALKQHMQPIDGQTYVWGGWGQGYQTDCSGGQSIGVNATEGNMAAGTGERAGTASFASYLPAHGYHLGQAPAGVAAHEIGWSDAHTSGTIFDPVGGDVNFEMGGGNGGGAFGGGAVSSRDGQFPNHAYVLLSADGVTAPTVNPDGTTTTPDATTTTPDTTTSPTTTPAASQETTFSGKLGAAAGSFVSGQLQSLFGVLGINDSPGALAAYSEYERQKTEKANSGKGSSGLSTQDAVNKGADPKKLREAEDKVTDTEASLATARARLAEVKANPKAKESAKLAAEARVAKLERELEQARKDLEELKKQQQATPTTPVPQSGDPNVGALTGTDAVKAAARSALKARGWDTGAQWDSTDWIFTRESSWNPAARNGQYLGLGQLSPDARKSIGDSLDPAEQTSAYADYVAGRYGVPTAAQQFWEANNWYDQGGIAASKGVMLKNVNQPERVLSPAQTKSFDAMVKRDFQSGSDAEVVARLDKLISLTERLHDKIDGRGDTYNFTSEGSARKDMEELQRARYAARLAGV